MELEVGMIGKAEQVVTQALTAAHCGSGLLPVFATPSLVALMENAACKAIAQAIPEGMTTVGTYIAVHHEAATPLGMPVWAEARLTDIDRRALTFEIQAFDAAGMIGSAQHKRFLVDAARFMEKTEAKGR